MATVKLLDTSTINKIAAGQRCARTGERKVCIQWTRRDVKATCNPAIS